jgi:hypothetical protein
MPGPSAWQALTIHGCFSQVSASVANDGPGHIAAQLVRSTGATLVQEGEPCDLLLDTAGGETLAHSASRASRSVTIADEIPGAHYFVEPTGEQFLELARLVDMGQLQPEIDSVCLLTEAQAAFSAQHRPRPVRQSGRASSSSPDSRAGVPSQSWVTGHRPPRPRSQRQSFLLRCPGLLPHQGMSKVPLPELRANER